MKSKGAVLLLLSAILWLGCWARVLWQWQTNVSPPRQVAYVTDGTSQWKERGYPQCRPPTLIDGDVVWRYCEYDNRPGGRRGLVRFDMEGGLAEMRWPLAEGAGDIPIAGLAKNRDGRIAVLRLAATGAIVDVLLPEGKVVALGELATGRGASLVKGMAWVDGEVELAVQQSRENATLVYRHQGAGGWRPKTFPWPDLGTSTTRLALARYQDGRWQSLIAHQPAGLAAPGGGGAVDLHLHPAGTPGPTKIASLSLSEAEAFLPWIDGGPGNLITSRIDFAPFRRLAGDAVRLLTPGPLASRLENPQPDSYPRIYVATPDHLDPVLLWSSRTRAGVVLQYPDGEVAVTRERSPACRRVRQGVLLEMKGARSRRPIVEEFRFASEIFLAPAKAGGWWALGTFGRYVRVGSDLERADPMGFVARFRRVMADFGSREAQYNDFLLEQAALKKLTLPVVLFGLPLLCLLTLGASFVRHRRMRRPAAPASRPVAPMVWASYGATGWLVLLVCLAYWFWKISIEF